MMNHKMFAIGLCLILTSPIVSPILAKAMFAVGRDSLELRWIGTMAAMQLAGILLAVRAMKK